MPANLDPADGKRLDSWKEIAAFLGRAERTVKRWENERGLPVHRVPGSGRGSVFAYSNELVDWLKGRSQELEEEDPASDEAESGKIELGAPPTASTARVQLGSAQPAPVSTGTNWPPSRLAAWLVPLLLAAALVVAFTFGHRETRIKALASPQPANAEIQNPPDSVAVLPFTNVRGDANSDYLSDGITESLIGNLARVPQIKVRSRDSVFRYKGKDLDLRTLGSNLGVSLLVSGRVMLRGNSLEVSAELTDVRENTEIWGQHYSGSGADILTLEQRIAGDIAQKLRSKLSSSERLEVTRQGTENPEAYELYLKGRYAWNKRTKNDIAQAISYFNEAIAKDPGYALAYSGLADAYSVMPNFAGVPSENFPKSNAAARKALELDATLAHPHAVLGVNETQYDWDFAGGENEFRKALELDPDDATAHQWYAEALDRIGGREPEALAEIHRAHQLDPLSPVISRVLGGVLVTQRRYDEAIAVCQKLANDNPTFAIAHDCLVYAYWAKGMYPQVVEEWKMEGQLTGNPLDVEYADALEQGFRVAGWRGAVMRAIEFRQATLKTGYSSPVQIAYFYAEVGDKEQAFHWLNTAYQQHDWLLIGLNTYFQLEPLRSDPRFAELVRKVGLPN
ncbi:MAG: hypothetical protein ACLQLC_08640 [Candidatus Sulfotelmatobacter sp.]